MLSITMTKSRFEISTTPENASTPAEVPHVVLSNLLDFAVTSPDLDERRKYIQRIMSLSKSVQKILMNLIERMKKTLPRKPKNTGSSRKKGATSPRILCGNGKNDTVPAVPDTDIHDPSMVKPAVLQNCEFPSEEYSDDGSDVSPPHEPPSRVQAFGTPKREQNVHGIPQSEPPKSTRPPQGEQRSRSASRTHQEEQVDPSAPKPRQPEGYYLPAVQKKRMQKGFASPPRDLQLKQKSSSSNKRHSTGSSNMMPVSVHHAQTQRTAFVSINNQSKQHVNLTRRAGVPPPPPPPPYPADQKLPLSATPSDEFEIDNHLSLPYTETTVSTTESSVGTNSDLAVLRMNSSTTERTRPITRTISGDKRRQSDSFSSPQRRLSLADSPVRSYTPEVSLAYDRDFDGRMLMSPELSVLQSPMQVDDFVKELRAKNKSLESILQSYQKRERELSQKMETTESKLRKEMMKLESRALGREDELRRSYDNEVAKLKKELRSEKEKNKESKRAKEELANANDELDLMQHTHEKLLEATEKIRKYKERIDTMNDYKEALEREQHAHNQSVDECVRLQNELKGLQPLKRQLEEYKSKSLELEVHLAECKDTLSRLERERDELNGEREDVLKEARTQRAQADELRKFIRLKDTDDGPGIGEGISELNPELHEELIKLRNENMRLREFADQRTDDSVQRLHENLEDATIRQERFKEEFLKTKNKLENSESLLSAAKQKLSELEADIEEKDKKAEEYQEKLSTMEDQYTSCLEDLEGLQQNIEELEEQKTILEADLAEWKQMADKLEKELTKRSGELDTTKAQLQECEELKQQAETQVEEWQLMSAKLEAELQRHVAELDETKQALSTTEDEKAQTEKDLAEWKQMSDKLQEELFKKHQELENTRSELSLMEEEKIKHQNEIVEWKQTAEQLEEDLKTKVGDIEETTKQLRETEDILRDAGHRQEELLNRIDECEKKLEEADERYKKLTKEFQKTSEALEVAEAAVGEAKKYEAAMNEENRELKQAGDQLLKQVREERKSKKEYLEESHKSLEATREVLEAKRRKDLDELQANMNQLLNDERKAYRLKAEKASVDYKKLEEKYQKKIKDLKDQCDSTVGQTEAESMRLMKEKEEELRKENERVVREAEKKREDVLQQSEAMVLQAKEAAKKQFQEMHDKYQRVAKELEKQKEDNQKLTANNASLSQNLQEAGEEITSLQNNEDELNEALGKLQQEKKQVEEEKEKYRQQLSGRGGVDGQVHSNQIEELNDLLRGAHEEIKALKEKLNKEASQGASMSYTNNHMVGNYSSGAANQSAMAEMKASHEEETAYLKEKHRECLMKLHSANVEVEKANQWLHRKDDELARLKAEVTRLKLETERARMAMSDDENENMENSYYSQSQARDNSFFSAKDASFQRDDTDFARDTRVLSPSKKYEHNTSAFSEDDMSSNFRRPPSVTNSSSPYGTPSKRYSYERNNAGAFSEDSTNGNFRRTSATGSSSPYGTPSNKYEHNSRSTFSDDSASGNFKRPSSTSSKSSSNPYELRLQDVHKKSPDRPRGEVNRPAADFTQTMTQSSTPGYDGDGQPECTQS